MCLDIIFYSRQPIDGVMFCRITCLTVACSVMGKLLYHRPIATDGIAKFVNENVKQLPCWSTWIKAISLTMLLVCVQSRRTKWHCSVGSFTFRSILPMLLANVLWYTNMQKCPHGKKRSFKLPTHQLHRSHPTVINLLLQLLHHDECFYYSVMMFANNGLPPAMYRRPAKVIISAHS